MICAAPAILALAFLCARADAWFTASVSSASPAANPMWTSSPAQNNQGRAIPAPPEIQVETLILKPGGFEPNELKRSAAPFLLTVNNRSRVFNLSFDLYREGGHKLHEMKGPKGQVRFMKMIDLPPGTYLLKEVNHPGWTCRIVLSH
jgi:hypothetical protein